MEPQFIVEAVTEEIAKITNTKAKDWKFDEQQIIEDAVARDVDPYYNRNFDGQVQVTAVKGGINIYVYNSDTDEYSDTQIKGDF